jgi:hypothetical protein
MAEEWRLQVHLGQSGTRVARLHGLKDSIVEQRQDLLEKYDGIAAVPHLSGANNGITR